VYRSLCNRGERAGEFADIDVEPNVASTDNPDAFDFDFDQVAEAEF
jgi:hypothetical protein